MVFVVTEVIVARLSSLAFVEAFDLLLLVLLEYIEDIKSGEICRNRGEQGEWQRRACTAPRTRL